MLRVGWLGMRCAGPASRNAGVKVLQMGVLWFGVLKWGGGALSEDRSVGMRALWVAVRREM